MARTHEERLFGAACLKLTIEARGASAAASEIYRGALSDLGLSEAEVDLYLVTHRGQVEAKLQAARAGGRLTNGKH